MLQSYVDVLTGCYPLQKPVLVAAQALQLQKESLQGDCIFSVPAAAAAPAARSAELQMVRLHFLFLKSSSIHHAATELKRVCVVI